MPKQILIGEDARNAILRGFNQVADIVGATLGPRSGTVTLGRPFGPALITKDGVTVAESISLPDPFENEGAKLIQEAARKTNQEAGDGTTAATILARAIFREGAKNVAAGANSMAIERGIQKAVAVVVEAIKELATPVDQSDIDSIRKVATISANGDAEMGDVIAQAVHKVGLEGVVMFGQPSHKPETMLEIVPGLRFDRGMVAAQFMTNPARGEAVYDDCRVFVTDRRLIDDKHMGAFLERYVGLFGPQVPLLIVAEDIAEGALQVLHVNNRRSCQVIPVRTPGSGPSKKDEIEDIAVYTGAKPYMIARGEDILKIGKDDFGSADQVVVTPHRTTIVGGKGNPTRIEARKDEVRSQRDDPGVAEFVKAQLERRLALLSASVAVIRIGSNVHSKLLEKRDRVEDAVNATKAALKEGIVPGGGVALIRCLPALRVAMVEMGGEERIGAEIVEFALTAPLYRLASNCFGIHGTDYSAKRYLFHQIVSLNFRHNWFGHIESPDAIVGRVDWLGDYPGPQWGYNAAEGEYMNLVAAGVIDPAKVVRLALQNAAELAGLLLTASAVVVDIPEPKPQMPNGGPR